MLIFPILIFFIQIFSVLSVSIFGVVPLVLSTSGGKITNQHIIQIEHLGVICNEQSAESTLDNTKLLVFLQKNVQHSMGDKTGSCPNNFYPARSIKPKSCTNPGSRGSCSSADGALEVPAKRDYRVLIMGASRVIKYNGSFKYIMEKCQEPT